MRNANKKEDFDIKKETEQFFEDGFKYSVNRKSDIISYPEFIKYFKDIDMIDLHNLIIGINFSYGWMPTIFKFGNEHFDPALLILNNAKNGKIPNETELELLKNIFNNSLVGTSKLLHFINPQLMGIWDSRVFWYLTGEKPHQYRIGNPKSYLKYLDYCNILISNSQFQNVKLHVEKKIGHEMTSMRVAELIMYTNGNPSKSKTV